MSAVVELRAASKRYGRVEALRGVSLAIHPGEVVAMLGPNGAGKTTSINLMVGLRRATSGQARLFGLDPADRRARSRCGVMLQESGVPGMLTVREVVDLFRSYYGAPLPAARALGLAGLADRAPVRVARLSGGERQRLYLALAVCGNPEVLFLDEPTVGMDVAARRACLDAIGTLAREGKTVVLTTHYLEEADQVASRIVVIDHGVIVADAAPGAIKARVPSKRVRFRSAGALDASAFTGLPVERLELSGGEVRFLSSAPEAVLRELFGRGVPIEDLEVAGAALEEAFLSLTGDSAAP
ncbi:MAG TPA: ABC transporter ATP-binding protein [Candidatus Binatia bacterium]|nr:ABC transporter ATP-binding protein [Candidatus Binatia bacterium]